jgi:hypothetical protein
MNAQATLPTSDAPITVPVLPADLSPVVRTLEIIYRRIAKKFADTPPATIIVKRDSQAWGYTTVAKVWANGADRTADADHFEIMISGENLRRGARETVATLLHESAHARNLAAGVKDCDSNGRHNKKFAATAETHGLQVGDAGGNYGWTLTSLTDETLAGSKWHRDLIDLLDKAINKSATATSPLIDWTSILGGAPTVGPTPGRKGRPTTGRRPGARPTHNLLKATCGCGSSIRLSRTVLDTCQPTCQVCDEAFTVTE